MSEFAFNTRRTSVTRKPPRVAPVPVSEHQQPEIGHPEIASGSDLPYQRAIATLEEMARCGTSAKSAPGIFAEVAAASASEHQAPQEREPRHTDASAAKMRYRALVEQIPAVTFIAALDENVHELYISPQIEVMLGFSQQQWLEDPFLWYWQLHPDDRAAWGNEFARTCSTGANFRSEYRFIARDGHVVWVHGECQLIKDDYGYPLFLVGIAFDITDRKLAEQRLQESNNALEQAVRSERQAYEALKQTQGILKELNQTLEHRVSQRTAELEAAQAQLVQTARRAGMAEVASNVLHNVGNVLNSVNVRASLVLDRVRKSRIEGFDRVCRLLEEHDGDLGRFISADERGKFLPGYIKQLTRHVHDERTVLLEDLNALSGYIDHIKQLISSQQSYAKGGAFYEPTDVADLVSEAANINAAQLDRENIALERNVPKLPAMRLDRHKILQILINLIANAVQACSAVDRKGRLIQVTVRQPRPESIEFQVADNGIGIAPDNLAQIFGHGFTTRAEGHGFGLHSAANAAQEMGGSLVASSDGLGRGAVFTLSLPHTSAGD